MNKTNNSKATLEQAFAIGRPARSAAHKTCGRCKGTGWWSLGRVCFACGGVGNAERVTTATQIRDKRTHIAEVQEIIASAEALLAAKVAAGAPSWQVFGRPERIAKDRANLARLEAELAALEAQS